MHRGNSETRHARGLAIRRAGLLGVAVVVLLVARSARADNHALAMSYYDRWAPYSQGDQYSATGILPALIDAIVTDGMGIAVTHVAAPWKRAQKLVEEGRLDGFVTEPTPERLRYTRRSRSVVYRLDMRAFVVADGAAQALITSDGSLDTLRRLSGCELLGNGWGARFARDNRLRQTTAPDLGLCLRQLAAGRFDYLIQPRASILHRLRQTPIDVRIVPAGPVYGRMGFALMIGKYSRFARNDFLARFDDTVRAMQADGRYAALIARLEGAQTVTHSPAD